MSKQPTILDVAAKSGYSKSTVSLVLQGSPVIPKSTQQAVNQAVEQLGYRYNRFARGLRTRRSHVIGMLIQDHLNPFYAELVHGVESKLRSRGYDLIVGSSNTDLMLEKQALERLFDHQVDGLIVSAMVYEKISHLLELFESRGTRCVVAGPPPYDIPFDSATVDFAPATMAAMEHLFNLGHRKIAFLWGAPSFQGIGSRFEVFSKAMKKHGLSTPKEWIIHCGFRLRDGYEVARTLLSKPTRPSAIFALNDLLALGVTSAAVDLGLKIPKDLSVLGVDNVEIASYMRPSLTTVGQPIGAYAEALASLVLEGFDRKERVEPRRIKLTAEMLIRNSTGRAEN